MKTVDDLLQELKALQIRKKSFDGSYYNIEVIDSDGFNIVEDIASDLIKDSSKMEYHYKWLPTASDSKGDLSKQVLTIWKSLMKYYF